MESFDLYPPKPPLIKSDSKGNPMMTLVSVVVFMLTFLFVFEDEAPFIINLLVVLLIHELGHFLLMKYFNYENVRMLFVPLMGAFVQGKKEVYSQRESFLVVAAGPFPGIVIGSVLIGLAASLKSGWMVDLGLLFLFLNLLNLLPLDPLDGGQLLKLLLKKSRDLFFLVFSLVSSLVLIGVGWWLDNWVLIVFGFVMGFRVRSIQRNYQLHKEMRREDVEYIQTYEALSNRDFARIKSILMENIPSFGAYMETLPNEQADELVATQVNAVLVSPVKQDASVFFRVLILLFWILTLITPFVLLHFYGFELQEKYDWYLEALSAQ